MEQRKQLFKKCPIGIESWLLWKMKMLQMITQILLSVSINIDDAKNTDNLFADTNCATEEVINNDDESAAPVKNPYNENISEADKAR